MARITLVTPWRGRNTSVELLFEPRDVWVGLYWDTATYPALSVYVCLVPCFPLLFTLYDKKKAVK